MIQGTVLNEKTIQVSTGTQGQELWIINGTFMFEYSSPGGDDLKKDQVTFKVGPPLDANTTVIDVSVTGAPTSLSTAGSPFALALDGIYARSDSGRIVVTGDVVVLGNTGFWRIGFQVQALVRRG